MAEFKMDMKNVGQDALVSKDAHAAVPEASRESLREAMRKNPSTQVSADAVEIVAGETVVDPQTLMKMFLLGKLTQGQLSHELKKFNDVQADSIIKDGKENVTKVIDYRQVGRASIANPGGDLKHNDEHQKHAPPPKNAREAKKEAKDTDDPKKKKEVERQEQKLKTQESLTTLRRLNNFTEAQIEQKNQHATRELKRREEETQNQSIDLDPRATSVDKAQKRVSAKDILRSRINEEIRRDLDRVRVGPGQTSQDKKLPDPIHEWQKEPTKE